MTSTNDSCEQWVNINISQQCIFQYNNSRQKMSVNSRFPRVLDWWQEMTDISDRHTFTLIWDNSTYDHWWYSSSTFNSISFCIRAHSPSGFFSIFTLSGFWDQTFKKRKTSLTSHHITSGYPTLRHATPCHATPPTPHHITLEKRKLTKWT